MVILQLAVTTLSLHLQIQAPKDLVDSPARVEEIVFGQQFAAGPVWSPDGRLLWSDLAGNTVYELQNGKPVVVLNPSQKANGHAFDAQGRLVSCLMLGQSVVRKEKTGKLSVLASTFSGKKLNGPADLAIRSDGSIYFTDPAIAKSANKPELDFSGVFRISPEGALEVLAKDLAMPNGIAFSRDESIVYVSDTIRHTVRAFDVAKDGSLSRGRVFTYLTGELPGAAAGIKVDTKGNVYSAGPGGVQVFDPAGKYLGLIYVRDVVTNFCFGEADRKTLYITGAHGIYRIRLKVAG